MQISFWLLRKGRSISGCHLYAYAMGNFRILLYLHVQACYLYNLCSFSYNSPYFCYKRYQKYKKLSFLLSIDIITSANKNKNIKIFKFSKKYQQEKDSKQGPIKIY